MWPTLYLFLVFIQLWAGNNCCWHSMKHNADGELLLTDGRGCPRWGTTSAAWGWRWWRDRKCGNSFRCADCTAALRCHCVNNDTNSKCHHVGKERRKAAALSRKPARSRGPVSDDQRRRPTSGVDRPRRRPITGRRRSRPVEGAGRRGTGAHWSHASTKPFDSGGSCKPSFYYLSFSVSTQLPYPIKSPRFSFKTPRMSVNNFRSI